MIEQQREPIASDSIPVDENQLLYGVSKPNPGCNKCFGRGSYAWRIDGTPVLCKCMSRPNKYGFITQGEFIKISNNRRPSND